jgi:hypothetical protein
MFLTVFNEENVSQNRVEEILLGDCISEEAAVRPDNLLNSTQHSQPDQE